MRKDNDVVVISALKRFKKFEKKIRKAAGDFLRFLGKKNLHAEIYLVGNRFMKKNVLAFPAPRFFPRPDLNFKNLGEVYLNPDYIERHAESAVFMLAHGLLHLLGYDHKKNNDRIKMQQKEKLLLKKIAIKD